MKTILIFCLIFSIDKEVLVYRELLHQSANNEAMAKVYFAKIKGSNSTNPLVMGYKAMAYIIMGRHLVNPVTRLNFFKDGKDILEAAIKSDTASVELAYLRFSVQSNIPAFLKYNANMQRDKKKMIGFFKEKEFDDKDLKKRMYNFVSTSKQFTAAEKQQVKDRMN